MKTKERTTPLLAERRYAGLDGLRAIAVLLVIAFHLLPGAVVGGYLGVDVFFVISGFLITALLLRERKATGGIKLGAFWARRARRLVPALVLLLLVCCAVALAVGGDRLLHLGRQVLGALTFSSNWLSVAAGASYYDSSAPELFRNLWSLAVEEQFYLIWPFAVLLLVLIRWRVLRVVLLLMVAAASATAMALLYSPTVDPTRIYYGTDTHSFGLALGAALAMLSRDWPLPVLSWPRIPRALLPVLGWAALAGPARAGCGNGGRHRVPLPRRARAHRGAHRAGHRRRGSAGLESRLIPRHPAAEMDRRALVRPLPLALAGVGAGVGCAARGHTGMVAVSVGDRLRRRGPDVRGGRLLLPLRGAAHLGDVASAPSSRIGRALAAGVPGLVATMATLALVFGLGTASALAVVSDPGKTELEQQLQAAQAGSTP